MRDIYPQTQHRVAEWADNPDVVGVLLVGSHSQGHSDALSDDDLEVLLTDEAAARLQPNQCSEVLADPGDPTGRKMIYDAQLLAASALRAKVASTQDLDHWPYQHARVLFARTGDIPPLVQAVAAMDPAFRLARLRHATIDTGIAARRAVKTLERGYGASGRLLIARGAKALARVLFALDGQWTPLDHWLEPALARLPDPTGAVPRLIAALTEARPEPLLEALTGLEDRLAAEGIPRGPGRRDLFFELVHPSNAAERGIHALQ